MHAYFSISFRYNSSMSKDTKIEARCRSVLTLGYKIQLPPEVMATFHLLPSFSADYGLSMLSVMMDNNEDMEEVYATVFNQSAAIYTLREHTHFGHMVLASRHQGFEVEYVPASSLANESASADEEPQSQSLE